MGGSARICPPWRYKAARTNEHKPDANDVTGSGFLQSFLKHLDHVGLGTVWLWRSSSTEPNDLAHWAVLDVGWLACISSSCA